MSRVRLVAAACAALALIAASGAASAGEAGGAAEHGAKSAVPSEALPVETAETNGPRFSDLTEALQRAQLRIGKGDRNAYPEVVEQLKTMAAAIAAAPAERWKNRREAAALVVYILSGGSLADVAPLMRAGALPESERTLARAAFAYITNHEADALELLRGLDLKALDLRVAGQVAFARSILETKRDPKSAIALLDYARLVAPGSLVEEAALRREILMLAEAHDGDRAAALTRQYCDRFPASLYGADFFRDLARTIARQGLADDPARYQRLVAAARPLPPESRSSFLLALARAAAMNGRFDAAATAAIDARKDAPPGGLEEARARLYEAAGAVFVPDRFDAAQAELSALAGAKFDRSDAGLLAAVRSVATQLRTAPSPGAVETQGEAAAKDKTGAGLTIDRAQGALQRTAGLVEGVQ